MDANSLNALRVVDLKELLKERDLPVAGRKQELVDRLLEHEASAGAEAGASAGATAAEGEGEGGGGGDSDAEDSNEQPAEEGEKEEEAKKAGGGEEEEVVDFEEVDDEEEEGQQQQQQQEQAAAAVAGKRSRGDEEESEEKEDEPSEKRQKTQGGGAGGVVILVENLSRPFTPREIEDLLSEDGPVLEVRLDLPKKAFCFARYDSEETAARTMKRLDGITWPHGAKVLSVRMSSLEEMRDFEEAPPKPAAAAAAASSSRRRSPSRSRSRSPSDRDRSRDRDRDRDRDRNRDRDRDRERDRRPRTGSSRDRSSSPRRKPVLTDLFKSTKASPTIFWLDATPAQKEINLRLASDRLHEGSIIRKRNRGEVVEVSRYRGRRSRGGRR